MDLKTKMAEKLRTTSGYIRALTSPKKAPKGPNGWEDLVRGHSPEKVGCWTAQIHRDRMRS